MLCGAAPKGRCRPRGVGSNVTVDVTRPLVAEGSRGRQRRTLLPEWYKVVGRRRDSRVASRLNPSGFTGLIRNGTLAALHRFAIALESDGLRARHAKEEKERCASTYCSLPCVATVHSRIILQATEAIGEVGSNAAYNPHPCCSGRLTTVHVADARNDLYHVLAELYIELYNIL